MYAAVSGEGATMPKPQQPELRRSGLGSTDSDAAELRAGDKPDSGDAGGLGPVPPENQPGHHPEDEQDKPVPGAPRS
jgi:hypothetical protein